MKSMNLLRRAIRQWLRKRGYELASASHLDLVAQTTFVRELIKSLDVSMVFDVGANTGQYRKFLRDQVAYTGKVVSFEPVPNLAAELRRMAAHEVNWDIYELALGETPGTFPINIMKDNTLTSFLKPRNDRSNELSEINVVSDSVHVSVERLDALYPELVAEEEARSLLLKLDTQGYDLQVLKGARGVLNRIVAIQSELSFIPIYTDMPAYSEVIDFLSDSGFDLAGIYRTNKICYPTRLLECDAYFVNRGLAQSIELAKEN